MKKKMKTYDIHERWNLLFLWDSFLLENYAKAQEVFLKTGFDPNKSLLYEWQDNTFQLFNQEESFQPR